MIIYMRHGNDNEKEPEYKQDNCITEKGVKDIQKFVKKMVKKYGYPKTILFSPFQRCTQTAGVIMTELIRLQTGDATDYCLKKDIGLSRIFTSEDKENLSVSPDTMKMGINAFETDADVNKRIKKHYKNTSKYNYPIWCITHALIYKRLAVKLNIEVPEHIEFLEYYVHQKYKLVTKKHVNVNRRQPVSHHHTKNIKYIKN